MTSGIWLRVARSVRHVVVAALVTVVALLAVGTQAAAALAGADGVQREPSVIVLGVPGLRWSEVTPNATPHLWDLAGHSAVGLMSARSARSRTCPADGWVELGTGNRARYPIPEDAAPGSCAPFPAMDSGPGASARVANWDAVVSENDGLAFDAVPGLLATEIAKADVAKSSFGCTVASGSGAGLGAARTDGWVDHWVENPISLTQQTLRECPLTVVGATPLSSARRPAELTALDEMVQRVNQMRPANSLLLVLGVSEVADERAQLHVALAQGENYSGGVLVSGSTRRAPFVQLSDVAPTVLTYLGIDVPEEMPYQAMHATSAPSNVADSLDQTVGWFREIGRQSDVQSKLTPPFFGVLVLLQALLYFAAFLLLRRQPQARTRSRVLGFTHVVAVAAVGGPAATYLANLLPWWEADRPVPALLGVIALADAALTAFAFAGPWRRHPFGPAGAVAGATAVVLAIDVVAGSPLQLASLAGYSPIVAGRFVGFGNLAFAVFGTAALLGTAALVSDRSRAASVTIVTVVGVAAVLMDGLPSLGSDFGGVIALVTAFGTLGILVSGRRLSWTRLLGLFAAGVLVVTSIAVVDYLRPADERTHLGRFVDSVLSGNAAVIVHRKLEANVSLLTTSVLTLMVPLVVIFLAFLIRRPSGLLPWTFVQVPSLRSGLLAVLVLGVVGALVNDSGVAIPAIAATVAVPVAVAVVARCMALAKDSPLERAEPSVLVDD